MSKKSTKSNGYSSESIQKVISLINEKEQYYSIKDTDDIAICISSGNRKIGNVMNVSIPPIRTCGNCSHCVKYCYDIKACLQYPNTVIDARVRNLVILEKNRDEYFSRIDKAMSRRRKNKYFRWHVAGEIMDLDYFVRMVENAKNHPDFIIWTYTKMYSIVNEYCDIYGRESIPSNFHIMFSEWDGMEMPNPYEFPFFTCRMPNGNINHPDPDFFNNLWKCPGNCNVCKAACRGCMNGENTFADLH